MKWNRAKDLMTSDVKTVEADWPVDRVARFLIDHGISGAPVVEDDQLMGVISLTDLARHRSSAGDTVSERPTAYYRHELEGQYSEEDLDNLHLTEQTVYSQQDNETLRTCYSYDKYGNRIGETEPNASLAQCPN